MQVNISLVVRVILFFHLFVFSAFFSLRASAFEVTTKPIITYETHAWTYKSDSIDALINILNQHAQAQFQQCRSGSTYENCCDAFYSSAKTVLPGATFVNGLPNYYSVGESWGTYYHKPVQSSPEQTWPCHNSGMTIRVVQDCPSGFTSRTTDDKMVCFKNEFPDSCPVGNPIDLSSGIKFEEEIDYSSADDLLKVERFYRGQEVGWAMEPLLQLNILPPGAGVTHPNQHTYKTVIQGLLLSLVDMNGNPDYKTYDKIVPLAFFNPGTERIAYLWQGRKKARFIESGGSFKSTDPWGKHITLQQNNTVPGAAWKVTLINQDAYYFSSSGTLIKTVFASGGSLDYVFSGHDLISKTDHLGRKLTYTYDSDHRLTTIKLPDNTTLKYSYGSDKNARDFRFLKKVEWSNGESISYMYNETGNLTGSNNGVAALTGKLDAYNQRIGNYKYSWSTAVLTEGYNGIEKKQLNFGGLSTTVTDALGSSRSYQFIEPSADNKLLTTLNQPAGSGCSAASKTLGYDAAGQKISETNFNGHKTQFAYDSRGLETVRVEGIPKTNNTNYVPANTPLASGIQKTSTQWHSQHRKPIKKAEPKLITTFIYNGDVDPFNNNQIANCSPSSLPLLCHQVQQATTDTNGASGLAAALDVSQAKREKFYTYTSSGQQLTEARVAGTPDDIREYYDLTTNDYTQGDLKSVTNALGHKTQFTRYDRNGRLLEMLDENLVTTQLTYDARGRVLSQTVDGATTTHRYDLNGNRIGTLLPNGVNVTYHYDAAKRLTAVENVLGDKIQYEYDVESNLRFERITNSGGSTVYSKEHVYDALSRVQNTLNSNQQGSTYLYDAKGNLTGEVDANSHNTNNQFDPLDRLTRTTDALSGNTDYRYDAAGNLTQVTDARNNSTTYTYNAFGDVISQTSPDTGTTRFEYDTAGNRIKSTDARGIVTNYTYDALNRIKTIKYPTSTENISFTYDTATSSNKGIGRLTKVAKTGVSESFNYNHQGLVVQKTSNVNGLNKTVNYVYNTAGQLTRITYPSGRLVDYSYGTAGQVIAITTKLGSAATQTLVNTISYLPFGPAQNFTYGNGLTHTQTYDQDYRLTAIQVGGIVNRTYGYDPVNNITRITNSINTNKSQTLTYDALDRLTNASGQYGNLGYTYDAVGNRLTATRNSTTDTYAYQATSNKLNSITRASGNRTFAYDNAGNRTQGTAENNSNQTYMYNQPNRLTSVSVNGTPAATYMHSPLGHRVMKTLSNGTKEIYHYDEAGQLIAVTDALGATVREYIYWGSQQIALATNNQLYYIHNDHLNTPQVITNTAQQVVWMGDYEPFGKLATNQANSIEIFSRFPGQYFDQETNLYYNYFRDYDPSVGRYIESDPIGLQGGINTYGYAYQNPITNYDPDGRFAFLLAIPALGGGSMSGSAALSGGLALGALWMANENVKKSPEEAALNREKNKYCKSPDPITGDACEDAKARLNRLEMCLQLRVKYGLKYGDPHDIEITNTTKAVQKAKEAVKNACKEECSK